MLPFPDLVLPDDQSPAWQHSSSLKVAKHVCVCALMQAVYTSLKETEQRATDLLPLWKVCLGLKAEIWDCGLGSSYWCRFFAAVDTGGVHEHRGGRAASHGPAADVGVFRFIVRSRSLLLRCSSPPWSASFPVSARP